MEYNPTTPKKQMIGYDKSKGTPYSPAEEVDLKGKDMSYSTVKSQQDKEEEEAKVMHEKYGNRFGRGKKTRKRSKKARKTRRRSRK